MKQVYHRCCKTAYITAVLLATYLTGMNVASAQTESDYTRSSYVPNNVGKIIPSENFTDARQKTRLVYETGNNENRLPEPVTLQDLTITSGNDGVVLRWRTTWEPDNLKLYEIEFSTDNITFQRAGVIPAQIYLNGKGYEFKHSPVNVRDRIFYRIRITDKNGRFNYSPTLTLAATGNTLNHVFPTVVNAGMVSLYLNDSFRMMQIVNMQGRILQTQILNGQTGRIDIPLRTSDQGICFVRVFGQNRQNDFVQKIFIQ